MASVEQENVGFIEEIGNLKEGMEKMAAMMTLRLKHMQWSLNH